MYVYLTWLFVLILLHKPGDLQTGERLVKIQAQTKSKAKAAASSASAADKAANTAAFGRSSKQSHTDQVLALAVTTDGKYLVRAYLSFFFPPR